MVIIGSPENVLAMLASAAEVDELPAMRWPHDRALQIVRDRASRGGSLGRGIRSWEFTGSLDGGVALVGLQRRLRGLGDRGWLVRNWETHRYLIGPDMIAAGRALLDALDPADRRLVRQTARRWSAWVSTSSKKVR